MKHLGQTSTSSNKQKSLPLRTKTSTNVPNVLPLFVTECQRAIKIHHQKEVAVRIIEIMPTLLTRHESYRSRPPKSVHELLERSRHVWETAPPTRFIGCWVKPTWMGGVVLLPLKMEVQLVMFSPLNYRFYNRVTTYLIIIKIRKP